MMFKLLSISSLIYSKIWGFYFVTSSTLIWTFFSSDSNLWLYFSNSYLLLLPFCKFFNWSFFPFILLGSISNSYSLSFPYRFKYFAAFLDPDLGFAATRTLHRLEVCGLKLFKCPLFEFEMFYGIKSFKILWASDIANCLWPSISILKLFEPSLRASNCPFESFLPLFYDLRCFFDPLPN